MLVQRDKQTDRHKLTHPHIRTRRHTYIPDTHTHTHTNTRTHTYTSGTDTNTHTNTQRQACDIPVSYIKSLAVVNSR